MTVELLVMWTVRRVQVVSFLALTAPYVPVELCAVSPFLWFGCLTRSYGSPTQKVLLLVPSFTDELVQWWVGGVGWGRLGGVGWGKVGEGVFYSMQ